MKTVNHGAGYKDSSGFRPAGREHSSSHASHAGDLLPRVGEAPADIRGAHRRKNYSYSYSHGKQTEKLPQASVPAFPSVSVGNSPNVGSCYEAYWCS